MAGGRWHQRHASTGPRPRGRGMELGISPSALSKWLLQRGRARAGAECLRAKTGQSSKPGASTGPRPRGRGMASPVTLSGTGSQQLNCDCLRPSRYPSLPAVDQSHTICSKSSVYVMRAPAGFSASPRRSRFNYQRAPGASDHITRSIQFGIGQTQRGNHTIPAPFRRSQPNKNHLVFVVVDNFAQSCFQFNLFRWV